jgi:alginate O-acetyltransferase complex protein AlgF
MKKIQRFGRLYVQRLAALIPALGLLGGIGSTPASAQQIARLYAPQAPEGSSYLRVVNPTNHSHDVAFAGKHDVLDPSHRMVTDYRVVDASMEVVIRTDGRALAPLKVKPGSFNTVVLDEEGAPHLIPDTTDGRDDLRAELRFYNLAHACEATLAIADGPSVFADVATNDSRKRVINPVQARLLGRCEAAGDSAPVALPQMQSGDHASVFLIGDSKSPHLVSQIDRTEPYSGNR